jgi:hypothetical protein
MRRPSLLKALAVFAVAAVVAGIALLAFNRLDPAGFADRKRELRIALGLPKAWVTDFHTDTAGYVAARCPVIDPIVIVTGGQSNGANALGDPLPADAKAQAFMVEGGKCWQLRDPVLGTTGAMGSLWTGLGLALYKSTGRPVVFINGAVGGVQLGDWLDDRSGYRQRLAARIAGARTAGLNADFVLWVQGETDAAVGLPPATFVAQLQALIARFDADGSIGKNVPWVIYRSTHCLERRNNGPEIDRAVTAFAATSDRIILGPNGSALGNDKRRDGCHFNGKGRDALTAEVLPLLLARLPPAHGREPWKSTSTLP